MTPEEFYIDKVENHGLKLHEYTGAGLERVVTDLILEYSRLMCNKQKEICADNADADYNFIGLDREDGEVYVIRASITEAPYPDELL